MQFKIVFALAFSTLAAAGALPRANADIAPPVPGNPPPTIVSSQCGEGQLRCCKSAQSPTSPAVPRLLHPLGISPSSVSGLVGITCTALPANAKAEDCSDAPVCCTDNSHGNTVSIGCNVVKFNS